MRIDRRQFPRGEVKGVAIIYDGHVESTELLDVGLGGMKVSGDTLLPFSEPVWVEFTLDQDTEMICGKRAQASLTRFQFDQHDHRYIMGFEFLSLTEFQQHAITNAISGR